MTSSELYAVIRPARFHLHQIIKESFKVTEGESLRLLINTRIHTEAIAFINGVNHSKINMPIKETEGEYDSWYLHGNEALLPLYTRLYGLLKGVTAIEGEVLELSIKKDVISDINQEMDDCEDYFLPSRSPR